MNENSVITNKMPSVVLILIIVLSSFAALGPTQNAKALGTESVGFAAGTIDQHYDIGEDIAFAFALSGLDVSLNYDFEWRVCYVYSLGYDNSDWVDGDCNYLSGFQSEPIGSEEIIPAGIDGVYGVMSTVPGSKEYDEQGTMVSFDTLYDGNFVIAGMLSVSGVTVATSNSTVFSVGSYAYVDVDLARSGDIPDGLDYSFDYRSDDTYYFGTVDYDLNWEIVDSASSVADSGTTNIGSTSSGSSWFSATSSGLAAGDYTLHVWLDRDGDADESQDADYEHIFSVSGATITGLEGIEITPTAQHYDAGSDIPFTISLTDLSTSASMTYDLEWRVCYVSSLGYDNSDWIDGDCQYMYVADSYGQIRIGDSELVDNSAGSDSILVTLDGITTITDGTNSFDVDTLSTGVFVVAVVLNVTGIIIETGNSSVFSVGSNAQVDADYERSGNIVLGADYSFSIRAENLHRFGTVDYDLVWQIEDVSQSISDSGLINIGGMSSSSGWSAATSSGLSAGEYTLHYWLDRDGAADSPSASGTHDFSVVDDVITGTESVVVSVGNQHYDPGDDVPFTIDISSLSTDQTTTYDLDWMVCNVYSLSYDNSDWVDRDCSVMSVSGVVIGVSETVDNTATDDVVSNQIDGVTTITDGSTTFDFDTLYTGDFVISVLLNVSGAILVSANTTIFSVGSSAWVDADLERSENILQGMDYEFGIRADSLHYMGTVDYELVWVVRNDNTGVAAAYGTHSIGTTTSDTGWVTGGIVPNTMMSYGDYTLYLWLERDGAADESEGAEYQHSFRVVNPSLNTLATVDVAVTQHGDGWGQAAISAYELDNGQHFTINWEVRDISNTAVDSGSTTWIAPPDTHYITLDFDHITNSQFDYCLYVFLYAANVLVDSDYECWTQASTADADSDGVLDADDMCPYDPVVANDANGDGCEDVDDTDGDGMPDDWENFYNTDPYTDDGAGDLDGDGVTNLDEFTDGTNPASSDTDEDFVNDGVDVCPLVWGDMANGCLTPINLPPICDIYFSLEMNGMVISGSAAIPAIPPMIPGGIGPQEIQVPAGTYYIIAVCTDPEGDMVTVTINGVTIGPTATATVGAVVNITENVEATVDVTVTWTDGVNTLTGAISITVSGGTNFDSDADGDGYTPGFTAALGVMSLLGAAIAMRRRRF